MRKIQDVIAQVAEKLPAAPPPEVADNIVTLKAELNVLARTVAYAAPEANTAAEFWARLSTMLYRYLPNPAAYPWAADIAAIARGEAE